VLAKDDVQSRKVVYQESAVESPDRTATNDNENAVNQPDEPENEDSVLPVSNIGRAVYKVGSHLFFKWKGITLWQLRKIVRHARSSPQCRKKWMETAARTLQEKSSKKPLMLILDVKTRWSLTHQMLRRSIIIPL
jgi:hypothetical protein